MCSSQAIASVNAKLQRLIKKLKLPAFRSTFLPRYPLLAESRAAYLPVFAQAFALAMADVEYLQQVMAESCKASISSVDYIDIHKENILRMLTPRELGYFVLYEYLKLHAYRICQQCNMVQGLQFKASFAECANAIAQRFLKDNPTVALNATDYPARIQTFLQSYDRLLTQLITGIITDCQIEPLPTSPIRPSREEEKLSLAQPLTSPRTRANDTAKEYVSVHTSPEGGAGRLARQKKRIVTYVLDLQANDLALTSSTLPFSAVPTRNQAQNAATTQDIGFTYPYS
jgi:hypothetical protein